MKHLVCQITHHGLGHLSQTAPVLNALRRRVPVALTVVSALPPARLHERIEGEFRIEPRPCDFGFIMRDALRIDLEASAAEYLAFHAGWDGRVAEAAQWLAGLRPSLLLANVGYLPLAAAGRIGLTALAMSSLNWSDLFGQVFGDAAWARAVQEQIRAAYACARAFIELTPSMAMPDIAGRVRVGTVARQGRRRHAELRRRLGVPEHGRLVAVMLGGVETRLPLEQWSMPADIHWLVPQGWQCDLPRTHALESVNWDFADLIASVDALVGKPGYGTFAEAACNGTPMLYALREDWPEQDALVAWFEAVACGTGIDAQSLQTGRFMPALAGLLQCRRKPVPAADGAEQAAQFIASQL